MEWFHLPEDKANCPSYLDWVEIFFDSGYISVHPGESKDFFSDCLIHGVGNMREIDWEEFFFDVLWIHKSVYHP